MLGQNYVHHLVNEFRPSNLLILKKYIKERQTFYEEN